MGTLDQAKIDQLRERAQREIDQGTLPSCQLALAIDGEIVLHEVYGDATLDTRYVVFSATKPVVASAAWILVQEGRLDVGNKVVDYIPEFATNGKDEVTVEQVMTFTSGFPHAPMGPPQWWTRQGRVERMAQWRLNWEPGTRYEYHATSAHWVLAEIVDRIIDGDYRDFIAERITGPLGIGDRLQVGVPKGPQQDNIATLHKVGTPADPEELQKALGISQLPITEVTDDNLMKHNHPDFRALGVPGGGGVSDATGLALFYQALLHNQAGIWKPDLLHDVTTNVRNTLTERLGNYPINYTLGLRKAGDDGYSHMRGFGRTVSPQAFGHNGAAGQLAWADPATGLSFVYLTNGIEANTLTQARRGVALGSIAAQTRESAQA
ncbi:MAG: hypothetical protein QOF60_2815 [Actinomycetota bacterium]|jgi:CubicO group peptidase (beta-lactamase class C family)|nr:hypothetical protein [Actinomycetota bacterium]